MTYSTTNSHHSKWFRPIKYCLVQVICSPCWTYNLLDYQVLWQFCNNFYKRICEKCINIQFKIILHSQTYYRILVTRLQLLNTP
jgi:hypothetical protein